MIYPWYDEDRWLRERFTRHEASGARLIKEYAPAPAVVYFRHSYASFRVRGLEYARLFRSGQVRYGVPRSSLDVSTIRPKQLVRALVHMFDLLADFPRRLNVVADWASENFSPDIARFFVHVSCHHQAEHWLESKLLQNPSIISDSYEQVRSQVVVAQVGEKPRGFIDLLALDKRNLLVWVIELKATKATGAAVSQAKDYSEWINCNLAEILNESFGYFVGIDNPSLYRSAITFVAPCFSSNFHHYIERDLPCHRVRKIQVNPDWRKNVRAVSTQEFQLGAKASDCLRTMEYKSEKLNRINRKGKKSFEGRRLWTGDTLINRLTKKANKYNLTRRDPEKYEYINLCWRSSGGDVAAQIHKCLVNPWGCVFVLGNSDEDCPTPHQFARIEDFTQLSGDHGRNKPWLRATGKTFGHRRPARAFFIPNDLLNESDNAASWKEVENLIIYATNQIN